MKNEFEAQRQLLKSMAEGGPGSGRRTGGGIFRNPPQKPGEWQRKSMLKALLAKPKDTSPRMQMSPPPGDVNYDNLTTPKQDRVGGAAAPAKKATTPRRSGKTPYYRAVPQKGGGLKWKKIDRKKWRGETPPWEA
jgi:hypothetical protein